MWRRWELDTTCSIDGKQSQPLFPGYPPPTFAPSVRQAFESVSLSVGRSGANSVLQIPDGEEKVEEKVPGVFSGEEKVPEEKVPGVYSVPARPCRILRNGEHL